MLYSSNRKIVLSGWLQANNNVAYQHSLKLQKFLFLYEAMTLSQGEKPDFDHLRGYKRGPVFSNVYGDYTNDRDEFNCVVDKQYKKNSAEVNEERASQASFIVGSLSDNELSELTHQYNIWASKSDRILAGELQVGLDAEDFNEHDVFLTNMLLSIYTPIIVNNSVIISVDDKYFVFSQNDARRLTEQHYDVMGELSANKLIHNPIFTTIDDEERLVVID